jgi:hypothetical protein
VTLEPVSFEHHECVRLQGPSSAVIISTSVGPRVLGLLGRGDNLFAILPEAGLERHDGDRFRFLGGHRLWAAPEIPEITYQPDDRPCTVTEVEDGIRVEAVPDGAGLIKSIQVRRDGDGWRVDHVLGNGSGRPLTVAPWAVTQLRLGGEVILPIGGGAVGLQADRSLVLWPYSDLSDRRVWLTSDAVHLEAVAGVSPLKLGAAPSEGWVSYRVDAEVFEKRVAIDPAASYPDRGAVVQVYLCDDFCELETVGSLREVHPGGAATHTEHWSLTEADG